MSPGAAVAAVILAGGQGRRMGGVVKPLLPAEGGIVPDRQLAALASADVLDVAVSIGAPGGGAPSSAELRAVARARGLAVVEDRVTGQGPLGGLAAALTWSPHEALLCLAGDLPEVAPALLALLAARLAGADAVVPRLASGVQPLLAAYGVRCAPVIGARLAGGLLRARELPASLASTGLRVVFLEEGEVRAVDPDLRSFINWNRPTDLER